MTDRDYRKEFKTYASSAWNDGYFFDIDENEVDVIRTGWVSELLTEIDRLRARVKELEGLR
jgi:hypothetical protein